MSTGEQLATSPATSRRMAKQRTRDTYPELAVRRELHRRGLRYRVQRPVLSGTRRKADIVFGPSKVAVFVHGCFWHGCPEHMTWPKSNQEFWKNKIERNMERDKETIELLRSESWEAVVIWEHENPIDAANRVFELVEERRSDCRPRKTVDLGDSRTGRGRSDKCQR